MQLFIDFLFWLCSWRRPRQWDSEQQCEAFAVTGVLILSTHYLGGFSSSRERLKSDLNALSLKTPEGLWLRRITLHSFGLNEALSFPPSVFTRRPALELQNLFAQLQAGAVLSSHASVLSLWTQSMNQARDAGLASWPSLEAVARMEEFELDELIPSRSPGNSPSKRL